MKISLSLSVSFNLHTVALPWKVRSSDVALRGASQVRDEILGKARELALLHHWTSVFLQDHCIFCTEGSGFFKPDQDICAPFQGNQDIGAILLWYSIV